MPALIVLFALAAGAIAYGSWYLRKKRREEVAALAARLGLRYEQGDPYALDESLPHRLFRLGDGRDCENVMWGTWQGLSLCAFDYWYYTTSTDSDGSTSRTYHRFSRAGRTGVLQEAPTSRDPDAARLREAVLRAHPARGRRPVSCRRRTGRRGRGHALGVRTPVSREG